MSQLTIQQFIQSVGILHNYAMENGLAIWLSNRGAMEQVIHLCDEPGMLLSGHHARDLLPNDYIHLLKQEPYFINGHTGRCRIVPGHSWARPSIEEHMDGIIHCMLRMPMPMRNKFYEDWTSSILGRINWMDIWQAHKDDETWIHESWPQLIASIDKKHWAKFWQQNLSSMPSWLEHHRTNGSLIINQLLPHLPTENLSNDCLVESAQVLHGVFKGEAQKLDLYSQYFPFIEQILKSHNKIELFAQRETTIESLHLKQDSIYLYFSQHGLPASKCLSIANRVLQHMGVCEAFKNHGLQCLNIVEHADKSLSAYFEFTQHQAMNKNGLLDIFLSCMDSFLNHEERAMKDSDGNHIEANYDLLEQTTQRTVASWLMEQDLEKKVALLARRKKI